MYKKIGALVVATLFSGAVLAANSVTPLTRHRDLHVTNIFAVTLSGVTNSTYDTNCQQTYARYNQMLAQASYSEGSFPYIGPHANVNFLGDAASLGPADVDGQNDFIGRTSSDITGDGINMNLDVNLAQWRLRMVMPGNVALNYNCIVEADG